MENNSNIEKSGNAASLWDGVELNFRGILEKHGRDLKVKNSSGEPFRIRIYEKKIRIDLMNEEDSYFEAEFEKNKEGSSIEFDIQTGEKETGKKIPGLYAQKLIGKVIEFFGGEKIDRIKFRWFEGSPEYEKYFQHQRQIISGETELKAQKRAASKTWVGKIAQENGFNELHINMFRRKRDRKLSFPIVTGYFYKIPVSKNLNLLK